MSCQLAARRPSTVAKAWRRRNLSLCACIAFVVCSVYPVSCQDQRLGKPSSPLPPLDPFCHDSGPPAYVQTVCFISIVNTVTDLPCLGVGYVTMGEQKCLCAYTYFVVVTAGVSLRCFDRPVRPFDITHSFGGQLYALCFV